MEPLKTMPVSSTGVCVCLCVCVCTCMSVYFYVCICVCHQFISLSVPLSISPWGSLQTDRIAALCMTCVVKWGNVTQSGLKTYWRCFHLPTESSNEHSLPFFQGTIQSNKQYGFFHKSTLLTYRQLHRNTEMRSWGSYPLFSSLPTAAGSLSLSLSLSLSNSSFKYTNVSLDSKRQPTNILIKVAMRCAKMISWNKAQGPVIDCI